MSGASALRGIGVAVVVASFSAGLLPGEARAVELMDGRVEVHGFYEAQIRSMVRDYDFSDDWDLTQWWNILNIEIEADIAPDGIGPFDLISVFGRIEVRYDCVWTGACGIFSSADAYRATGKQHRRRLPKRLMDARRTGYTGTNFTGDRRHFYDVPYSEVGHSADPRINRRPDGSRKIMRFWQSQLGDGFFTSASYGPDGLPAIPVRGEPGHLSRKTPPDDFHDDAPLFIFRNMVEGSCNEFGARSRRGGTQNGRSEGDILLMNPACSFKTIGAAAAYPNPFRAGDFNPVIGSGGAGELPYRPAPDTRFNGQGSLNRARGLWYPNYRLQQMLNDGDFDKFPDTPLTRSDVAWNHGQAQREQRELKELYADIEMFDSQLWIRAGYQTIVWGKTELFRNQDQFNPQDLGLASLPSLEESRISLWALRAVWSFYDVGPFQDVRVEVAANLDSYEPTDVGLCGEPYSPLAACALSVGQIAHGYFGFGLAGAKLPPNAWNSWHGIEVGGRVEWRWDRFSFAITDFYGFQDFPYVNNEFRYSRNVDPVSGLPRHTETTGKCRRSAGGREVGEGCQKAKNYIDTASTNQTLYALTCAGTIAVSDLDPTACLANIFGSQAPAAGVTRVVVALGMLLQGDGEQFAGVVLPGVAGFTEETTAQIVENHVFSEGKVSVELNRDINDGPVDHPAGHPLVLADDYVTGVAFLQVTLGGSISDKLTDEQEALLGCGVFYDTSCDLDGIDLLNAEASAIYQSWPNVQGTFLGDGHDNRWNTTDDSRAQPGTVGFDGGALCTRYENGKTFVLPGCRGPGDSGYDPSVDGTVDGIVHPFTGQQFQNEMAGLSWNALMGLVALSVPGEGEPVLIQNFDVDNPFREGGCSFRQPQWCSNVTGLLAVTGVRRNSINAGGNGRYGRRDFVWHTGGTGVARVDKANVLGFSMDFAEDVTKSNWGVEFTWVNNVHVGNNNSRDGVSTADLYRLTVSVDRPTFVNFLNANRTFFINTQWFFQYTQRYKQGYTGDGPWNIFGVLAISTGYFQDRLLPSMTLVYFVMNNSIAFLPSVTYRFNEAFSATFGIAAFSGRESERVAALNGLAPEGERFGRNANKTFVENGLSVVRERDEIFLRVRYTF